MTQEICFSSQGGPSYEIAELTAIITLGSADQIFIRMKVAPAE